MKRPTMLVEAMLEQFSMDLDLSVERDIAVMRSRCEHEGLSFLTLTLPLLSDALERGLEEGRLTVPTQFSRTGSLPRFLGGFFSRVFTRMGEPRDDICVKSLFAIRQICRFFKKLEIPCSGERELAAIRHFIDVEGELGHLTPSIGREDYYLDKISRIIWLQVFPEVDPLDIVCQHGPGATGERLSLNERHRIRHWYSRAEGTFPSDLHAFPNFGLACLSSGLNPLLKDEELDFYDIRNEPSVRVVFVPKTLRAPRVIAIEPSPMQFIQQGLMRYIVERLESHSFTRHSVRFSDQTVNQSLAHRSSIDRSLATLDLKDASDRVHFRLVQRIFSGSGILEYLEDARSLHATLPNGRNLILNKFASMGSAICFPVEAMVFYTLIQAAVHSFYGRHPTSSSISEYSRLIDIYGDDIIVPVELADVVVDYLESYGLKVNLNKSFRQSLFRESCGGDYYGGVAVKPVYLRKLPPEGQQRWTPTEVMSWVSSANQFYKLGMWKLAQTMRQQVEKATRRRIPRSVREDAPGIFFSSFMFTTDLRFNSDLYGYEQKRLVYQPTKKKDSIDGDEIATLNRWGYTTPRRRNSRNTGPGVSKFMDASGILSGGSIPPWSRDTIQFSERLLRALSVSVCADEAKPHDAFCISDNTPAMDSRELQFFSESNELMGEESVPVRHGFNDLKQWNSYLEEKYGLTPNYQLDSVPSLDFTSSMKRGVFKSKHRWVTLIT